MRFAGYVVISRSETPGEWIEVEMDGPANLRGYDPTLIEYESVGEAREAKRGEIRRRVVAEADAVMPVWEFIYITRARISDPRTTTLEAIAEKGRDLEGQIDAIADDDPEAESKLEAITWS